eukprot:UN14538
MFREDTYHWKYKPQNIGEGPNYISNRPLGFGNLRSGFNLEMFERYENDFIGKIYDNKIDNKIPKKGCLNMI